MAHSLEETFRRLRAGRRKALIPFVMGGDPDLKTTQRLVLSLQDAGADVIEVGIPFSDPLADGPAIQAATLRALQGGTTPKRVIAAIAQIRSQLKVPVVYLTYWNPVIQFGPGGRQGSGGAFLKAVKASGASGLIVPDLPVEESAAFRKAMGQNGLETVFLAAPTSSPTRLRQIAKASKGFVYYVSVAGTTGARKQLSAGVTHGVRKLRMVTTKPICVGFGISTPAQAGAVARIADGVIVGSALIQAVASAKGLQARIGKAKAFLSRLRKAV